MYQIGGLTSVTKDFCLFPLMSKYNAPFARYNVYNPGHFRPAPLIKFPVSPNEDYEKIFFNDVGEILLKYGYKVIIFVGENIVTHPFIVLQRQSQVNVNTSTLNIFPHAFIPILVQLYEREGLPELFKGMGSILVMRVLQCYLEELMNKYFSWPTHIHVHTCKWKDIFRHILSKATSWLMTSTFYAAALVETVNSKAANPKPRPFDVVRFGLRRIFCRPVTGRKLPFRYLILPTAGIGLLRSLSTMILKQIFDRLILMIPDHVRLQPYKNLNYNIKIQDRELYTSILATLLPDIVMYPMHTVIHRCLVQGTGVVVDHMDGTKHYQAILTYYEGLKDCSKKCLEIDGELGYFRGIGATFLQYAAFFIFVRVARKLYMSLLVSFYKDKNPTRNVAVDEIEHTMIRTY